MFRGLGKQQDLYMNCFHLQIAHLYININQQLIYAVIIVSASLVSCSLNRSGVIAQTSGGFPLWLCTPDANDFTIKVHLYNVTLLYHSGCFTALLLKYN